MQALNIFSHLDMLEEACAKITEKFQVENTQIEKLLNGISNLKKNQDSFIPQIAICGDSNVGKTTLIKYLFHDLWPDIVRLPGGPAVSMGAPTIIRFIPNDPSTYGQQKAQFETNYFSREEYIDAVIWTLENLLDAADTKTQQIIVEASASRSFEDIRKACEAALAVCGGDKPALRKHFRLIEEDCRDTQKLEDSFATLNGQNYKKVRDDVMALQSSEIDTYSAFVKSVTINVSVEANAIPCAFQVIDLPGFNSEDVLSLHSGINFAQTHADAFVVCLSSAEPNMDDATVRYLSKIIGRDSLSSSRARVVYALTQAISVDDKQDIRFSETLLENLISTHHWAEPGLAPNGQRPTNNVFVIDALGGVLHDMRSASDLNTLAREHLGVASDQEYKAIKKKWNSGRIGQDNQTLKLLVLKFITYTLPKENFQAVKSAAADLIAKYKSIVAGVKPEQSKWHLHSLNTLQHDARLRFDDCAASVEAQLDVLHRTLRSDIISKLNATLAMGRSGDTAAKEKPAPVESLKAVSTASPGQAKKANGASASHNR